VVRQTRTCCPDAEITIATSISQIDPIRLQLGQETEIVAEPERRGTFPAIALACAHIASKGTSRTEPVVVIPCDVYADDSYFRLLCDIARAADDTSVTLMGIPPTTPEIRFGYILPHSGNIVPHPEASAVKQMIKEGALWNAGVFGFTMGFAEDCLGKMGIAFTEDAVREAFVKLPHSSFDTYLSQTDTRLQTVLFSGDWKDLGTWESLSAHIPHHFSGNVSTSADVTHTHILNELDLPIVCVGVDNLIVSASPDGILIADKRATDSIKEHAKVIHARPMYEERRWGWYRVMGQTRYEDGQRTLTKLLHLNRDASISYQRHTYRDEIWTFVDGEALLMIDDEMIKVGRGYVANIKRGQKHAVKALTPLEIIEVQTGDPLIEEDIERFPYQW